MHVLKRRVAKYTRWLHIYASMITFAVVLFFSVTGWTLNHPSVFAARERRTQVKGSLETRLTGASVETSKLEIVEAFRRDHGVAGALTDFRVDDDQLSIAFKGPGYSADAFVDRRTGAYELSESRLGMVAIANDLHKGRDTGGVWKAVIDISAALLTFISLTGLVLLYFVHKHRVAGLILLLAGAGVSGLMYLIWVP